MGHLACGPSTSPIGSDDHDSAAICPLVAFSKVQLLIDGFYRIGGDEAVDDDERAELQKVQSALRLLWRYHDKLGGKAARPYAQYVGAVEKRDLVNWERGQ